MDDDMLAGIIYNIVDLHERAAASGLEEDLDEAYEYGLRASFVVASRVGGVLYPAPMRNDAKIVARSRLSTGTLLGISNVPRDVMLGISLLACDQGRIDVLDAILRATANNKLVERAVSEVPRLGNMTWACDSGVSTVARCVIMALKKGNKKGAAKLLGLRRSPATNDINCFKAAERHSAPDVMRRLYAMGVVCMVVVGPHGVAPAIDVIAGVEREVKLRARTKALGNEIV